VGKHFERRWRLQEWTECKEITWNASNGNKRNGITKALLKKRNENRLQTALKMESIEPYIKRRADRHLEKVEL
jgi:hypothetical protein